MTSYRLTADTGAVAYIHAAVGDDATIKDMFKRWGFGNEIRPVASVAQCSEREATGRPMPAEIADGLREAGLI